MPVLRLWSFANESQWQLSTCASRQVITLSASFRHLERRIRDSFRNGMRIFRFFLLLFRLFRIYVSDKMGHAVPQEYISTALSSFRRRSLGRNVNGTGRWERRGKENSIEISLNLLFFACYRNTSRRCATINVTRVVQGKCYARQTETRILASRKFDGISFDRDKNRRRSGWGAK